MRFRTRNGLVFKIYSLLIVLIISFIMVGSQDAMAEKKCDIPKETKASIGSVEFSPYEFCERLQGMATLQFENALGKEVNTLIAKLPRDRRENEEDSYRKHYKAFLKEMAETRKFDESKLKTLNVDYPVKVKKDTDKDISVNDSDIKDLNKIIAAPGVFTTGYTEDVYNCEFMRKTTMEMQNTIKDKDASNPDELSDTMSDSSVNNAKGNEAVSDLGKGFAEGFVSPDAGEGDTSKGLFGVNCSEYSILKNLSKIFTPVNITQSQAVMNVVYTFQLASLAIGVLLTSIFGVYYMTGNETTDPVKFVIRAFMVMMVVYYLPYFAQDILNINNMLTYYISNESLNLTEVSGETQVAGGLIAIFTSLATSMSMAASIFVFGGGVAGIVLVGIIILLAIFFFFLKPLLSIIFWWYFRLVMIIFLIVLGPLFIMMMLLPKTADFGKKWLMSFIGETFTQTFMVIVVYFAGEILKDTATLKADMGFGFMGMMIFIYGIILLMSKVPNIAKSLIGGGIDGIGWNDAVGASTAITEFAKNAAVASAGAMAGRVAKNNLKEANLESTNARNHLQDLEKSGATGEKLQLAQDRSKNAIARLDKMKDNEKRFENAQKFLQDAKSGNFNGGIARALDNGKEEIYNSHSAEDSERKKNDLTSKFREKAKDTLKDHAVAEKYQKMVKDAETDCNENLSAIDSISGLKPEEKRDAKKKAENEKKRTQNYALGKIAAIDDKIAENREEFDRELMDNLNNVYRNDKSLKSINAQKAKVNEAFDEVSKAAFGKAGLNADGSMKEKTDFKDFLDDYGYDSGKKNEQKPAITKPFDKMPGDKNEFQNGMAEKLTAGKNLSDSQKAAVNNQVGNLFEAQQKSDRTTTQGKENIANGIMEAAKESGVQLSNSQAMEKANSFLEAYSHNDEIGMKEAAEFTNPSNGKVSSAVTSSKLASDAVIKQQGQTNTAMVQFVEATGSIAGVEIASQVAQEVQSGASVMQAIDTTNSSPAVLGAMQSSISSGAPLDKAVVVEATASHLQSMGVDSATAKQYASQNFEAVNKTVGNAQATINNVSSGGGSVMTWDNLQQQVETDFQSAGLNGANVSSQAQQIVSGLQDSQYQKHVDYVGTMNELSSVSNPIMSKSDYIENNPTIASRKTSAHNLTSKGQEIIIQQVVEGKNVDAGFVSSQIGAGDMDISNDVVGFASGVKEMLVSAQINEISNGSSDLHGQIYNSFRDNGVSFNSASGELTGRFNETIELVQNATGASPEVAKEYVVRTAQSNSSGISNFESFELPKVENIVPQQIDDIILTETIEGVDTLNTNAFQNVHISQEVEQAIKQRKSQISQAYKKAKERKNSETNE